MADDTALIRFLDELKNIMEPGPARAMATQAFFQPEFEDRSRYIAMGTSVHPFFVPEIASASQARSLFNAEAWCKSVAMARAVSANTAPLRILLSSAPKSGSTFLSSKIGSAFRLTPVNLVITSALLRAHVALGEALREQHIDELALLTTCFTPNGFLSHRHVVCTPYMAHQMNLYNVKTIITYRNIFDTFVSYDEHLLKASKQSDDGYLLTGLPDDWGDMDFDDRMDILLDVWLGWYVKFFASWRQCEEQGLIRPIRISYDRDLLGDKTVLATRICEQLGRPEADIPMLAAGLGEQGGPTLNVNVGVAGRGEKITGRNRTRILDYFHKYRNLADFSEILDQA